MLLLLAFRFKRMIVFPKARRRALVFLNSIPKAFLGKLLTHQFEPGISKRDRTGLELRKSMLSNTLRLPGKESIVTKRVALGELSLFLRKKRRKVNAGRREIDARRFSFLPNDLGLFGVETLRPKYLG